MSLGSPEGHTDRILDAAHGLLGRRAVYLWPFNILEGRRSAPNPGSSLHPWTDAQDARATSEARPFARAAPRPSTMLGRS